MYLMALSDSTIHPGSGKWSSTTRDLDLVGVGDPGPGVRVPAIAVVLTVHGLHGHQARLPRRGHVQLLRLRACPCRAEHTFSCSACAHVRVALNVSESYGGRMLVDELDGLPEIPLGPDVEQALGLHSSGTAAVQRMALSRKAAEHVVQVDDHAGVSGGREDRQEVELHLLHDDPECVGPELPS